MQTTGADRTEGTRQLLQLPYNNPTRAAIGALVSITLLGIGLQGWHFADTLAAPKMASLATPQRAVSAAVVAQIAAAGLFGQAGSGTAQAQTPPDSHLGWVLRGVFTGATPDSGSAIIETEPGKSHLVRAGQPLPGGSRLVAVYDDRVVIERNGQRETLRFPIPTAAPAGNTDVDQAIDEAASHGVTITPQRREEIRKRLEQLRQRAIRSEQ